MYPELAIHNVLSIARPLETEDRSMLRSRHNCMGKMEQSARKQRVWGHIQAGLLTAVGIAGVLLVTMAAPNTLQLLGGCKGPRNKFNFRTKTAMSRLVAKGLLTFEERDGKRYARLTTAGQKMLEMTERETLLKQQRNKRWDKRWRVIIFDIPENKKRIRDRLRETVKSFGFLHLQHSVWVYPHDCEDLIILLKAELKIGKDVLYMIVENLENDERIRRHFFQ
jgi:CRISPR-associated endonuclease Cas2